jgi:hypothetical protein
MARPCSMNIGRIWNIEDLRKTKPSSRPSQLLRKEETVPPSKKKILLFKT